MTNEKSKKKVMQLKNDSIHVTIDFNTDAIKEVIAEYKKEYGSVFKGHMECLDYYKNTHTIDFLFRKPNIEDVTTLQQTTKEEGLLVASIEIVNSIIVYPTDKDHVTTINKFMQTFPNPVTQFVMQDVSPFLGSAVKTEVQEL